MENTTHTQTLQEWLADREHTHTLTFSLRDWRKGSETLERIGWNDEMKLTDHFELKITSQDQAEHIIEELNQLDLEFTFVDCDQSEIIN